MTFERMTFRATDAERSSDKGHENDVERTRLALEAVKELLIREPAGIGRTSDFYADRTSAIGVKRLMHPEKLQSYENTLEQEGQLQSVAFLVVEKARMQQQARVDAEPDETKKEWLRARMPAKIPAIIGYVKDEAASEQGEPSEYLIMETVRGKTLSHLMLQKLAEGLYRREPEKYGALKEARAWREDVLADALFTQVDELKGLSPGETATIFYNTLRGSGVISETIALQVGAAVRAINNEGVFHRDLHERNIMVSEDESQAWIIDFGLATSEPGLAKATSSDRRRVYELNDGSVLWDDQNAVQVLPNLTNNPTTPLKPGARKIRL
jgi:serine/threonine protein kinase